MTQKLFTVSEAIKKLGLKSRGALLERGNKANIEPKKENMGQTKIIHNLYSQAMIDKMAAFADPRRKSKKEKK